MEKKYAPANYFYKAIAFLKKNLPKREWDWQTAALAIALTQIAIGRLVITEWTPTLKIVGTVGFSAIIIGLVIGYSSFTSSSAILAGLDYGLLLIPFQLIKNVDHSKSLFTDLQALSTRLLSAFGFFIKNEPVYDTLFFTAVCCFIFWCIGVHAGYQLTRHSNFLRVVIPSGLAMLIVQLYDPISPLRLWGLAVYAFMALALLGRLYYLDNKTVWKNKRVFTTSDSDWDVSRGALTTAAIVIIIAWAMPGALLRIESAAQGWEDLSRPFIDRFSDAVSPLESPYGSSGDGNPDFFGSDLGLGLSAPTSDIPVFFIHVNSPAENGPIRYYWRGRAFDQYIHGQWANSILSQEEFTPGSGRMQIANIAARSETTVTVTLNFQRQKLIYAPSEVSWTDVESQLSLAPASNTERDVVAISATQNLVSGDSYETISLIANPSIEELRSAGNEYPQWVADRYLQIPVEIEPELKELAEQVAGQSITTYDKTQAITEYLRNDLEYVTQITETPARGMDPVLWVLFDYKKGFCMYSASAEVLLLRSLGIPARMAVGFAQGDFDPETGNYIVERRDAHAWPEVYFPNIGWVEFEPTGNQNPLNRPLTSNDASLSSNDIIPPGAEIDQGTSLKPPADEPGTPNGTSAAPPSSRYFLGRSIGLLFIIGIIAVIFSLTRRYSLVDRLPVYLEKRYIKNGNQAPRWLVRWSKWAKLTPIERAFHSVNISLQWLSQSIPAHATPGERSQMLAKILPSVQEDVKILEHELETSLFTNRTGNFPRARRASIRILFEALRARRI